MKKIILFLFTSLLVFSNLLFAQENETCQSIMMIKKNFIEKNLTLSEIEKPLFWNIYNPYLKEESEIFEASRALLKLNKIERVNGKIDFSKLSEKQLFILMEDRISTKEKLLILEKKLYQQLKKCFNAKTIHQIYLIERRFMADIKEEAKGACPPDRK